MLCTKNIADPRKLSQHIRQFVERNKLDASSCCSSEDKPVNWVGKFNMAAARLSVGLQTILVMSLLLLQMQFLPCTLAAGGNSAELLIMAGREKHDEGHHRLLAPTKSIRSPRTLLHENWTGPRKLYLNPELIVNFA